MRIVLIEKMSKNNRRVKNEERSLQINFSSSFIMLKTTKCIKVKYASTCNQNTMKFIRISSIAFKVWTKFNVVRTKCETGEASVNKMDDTCFVLALISSIEAINKKLRFEKNNWTNRHPNDAIVYFKVDHQSNISSWIYRC